MKPTPFSLGQGIIAKQPCFCFPLEYTAPAGGGDVVKSRADLLADATAKATAMGLAAPTGMAFDLQQVTVATYSKGTPVVDNTSDVETITSIDARSQVTCGGQITNVNPYGGNKPFGLPVHDEDCNGESDNLLPADFQVEITDGSAIALSVCITPVLP